ncbi:MAG: VOC family protein, partial [Planctomycetota bacterium]
MAAIITGIHHVTALAGEPKRHVAFYREVLGLRLVKKTVNFDDPHTYHTYYGDAAGSPGTLLTHFPHPHITRASHGHPEIARTALAVPEGAIGRWAERLSAKGFETETAEVGGRRRLLFDDPDGMQFALVESVGAIGGYAGGGVEPGMALGPIASVELAVEDVDATADFLEAVLGFERGAIGEG